MSSLLRIMNRSAESLFGYIGIAMIFIASYSVLARTVLHISATWTDEVLKMLLVWSIFTCSGLAFLKGELIGLDIIFEKLKNKPTLLALSKLVQNLFSLLFGCLTVMFAINIIDVQIMTGEATTVVQIPLWIINLGFLLGNFLISCFAIYKSWICIKDLQNTLHS